MFLGINRLECATSWFHMAFVELMYWVEVESWMQVRRRVLYCNGSYWFVLGRITEEDYLLYVLWRCYPCVPITSQWWIAEDHEQNQWIKILSWGDNSLTEFYCHKPNDGGEWKKATCLLRRAKLTDQGFHVHLLFLRKTCINLIKQFKNEYSGNNSR